MTSANVLARIKARLGLEDVEPRSDVEFNILQHIPTALQNLAEKIARDPRPDIRNLLRKDFSVTVTSGIGSLTTALTASEPLLINEIKAGNLFVTSGTTPCQWLPDRTQLGLTRPNFFIWYTVDLSTIRTRNTDGLLTSLNTTITLSGNYVPLLSSVPATLEDEFLDSLMAVMQGAKDQPEEVAA